MTSGWTCAICGEEHDTLPTVYGAPAPWPLLGVTPEEFEQRVETNADLCVVDGKHFFVRGHIELRIEGQSDPFAWSVWCSLSHSSFERMMETWTDDGRDEAPPYFGWLCTELPTYPSTLHLKTHVQNRKPGEVPLVHLEPTDHPLAVEQREGITIRRVEEIAHAVLGHGDRR